MTEMFLDTAYLIALTTSSDTFHAKASQLAQQLVARDVRLVTTRAVLLEVGNALSKQRCRSLGVRLLKEIGHNKSIEIVPLSESLYFKALSLFQDRMDKEWGLVDCVSFIVMKERGITQALTCDQHFQQMGFQALLCENYL